MGGARERVGRGARGERADGTNVRVDGRRWWKRGGARGTGDARGWRVDDDAASSRARRRDGGVEASGVHRGGDGGGDASGPRR